MPVKTIDSNGYSTCACGSMMYCRKCPMFCSKGMRDIGHFTETQIEEMDREIRRIRVKKQREKNRGKKKPKKCIYKHPKKTCKCWLGFKCVIHSDPFCEICPNFRDPKVRKVYGSRLRAARHYQKNKGSKSLKAARNYQKKKKQELKTKDSESESEEEESGDEERKESKDVQGEVGADLTEPYQVRSRQEYPVRLESDRPFATTEEIKEYLHSEGCRPEQCGKSGKSIIYYRCQGVHVEDGEPVRCPCRWRVVLVEEENGLQLWTNGASHSHTLAEADKGTKLRWANDKRYLLGSFQSNQELDEALKCLSRNKCFNIPFKTKRVRMNGTLSKYYECSKGSHRQSKEKARGPNFTGCRYKIATKVNEAKHQYELYANGKEHNHEEEHATLEDLLMNSQRIQYGRLCMSIRKFIVDYLQARDAQDLNKLPDKYIDNLCRMINNGEEVNGCCYEPHRGKTILPQDQNNHVTPGLIKRVLNTLKAKKPDDDPIVSLHKTFDKYDECVVFRSNIFDSNTIFCVAEQGRYPFAVLTIPRDRYMVALQSPDQNERMKQIQKRVRTHVIHIDGTEKTNKQGYTLFTVTIKNEIGKAEIIADALMPQEDYLSCVVALESLRKKGLRCDYVSCDKSTCLGLAAVRVFGCEVLLCAVHVDREISDWLKKNFLVSHIPEARKGKGKTDGEVRLKIISEVCYHMRLIQNTSLPSVYESEKIKLLSSVPQVIKDYLQENWFAEETVQEARWIERRQHDICSVPNFLKCPTSWAFHLRKEGMKKVLRMEQTNNLSEGVNTGTKKALEHLLTNVHVLADRLISHRKSRVNTMPAKLFREKNAFFSQAEKKISKMINDSESLECIKVGDLKWECKKELQETSNTTGAQSKGTHKKDQSTAKESFAYIVDFEKNWCDSWCTCNYSKEGIVCSHIRACVNINDDVLDTHLSHLLGGDYFELITKAHLINEAFGPMEPYYSRAVTHGECTAEGEDSASFFGGEDTSFGGDDTPFGGDDTPFAADNEMHREPNEETCPKEPKWNKVACTNKRILSGIDNVFLLLSEDTINAVMPKVQQKLSSQMPRKVDIRPLCVEPSLENWPEVLKAYPAAANDIELLKPFASNATAIDTLLESFYKQTSENLEGISSDFLKLNNEVYLCTVREKVKASLSDEEIAQSKEGVLADLNGIVKWGSAGTWLDDAGVVIASIVADKSLIKRVVEDIACKLDNPLYGFLAVGLFSSLANAEVAHRERTMKQCFASFHTLKNSKAIKRKREARSGSTTSISSQGSSKKGKTEKREPEESVGQPGTSSISSQESSKKKEPTATAGDSAQTPLDVDAVYLKKDRSVCCCSQAQKETLRKDVEARVGSVKDMQFVKSKKSLSLGLRKLAIDNQCSGSECSRDQSIIVFGSSVSQIPFKEFSMTEIKTFWITDQLMDYFGMCADKYCKLNGLPVHVISCMGFHSLTHRDSFPTMIGERMPKEPPQYILIFENVGTSHWGLLLLDMDNFQVHYFDSLDWESKHWESAVEQVCRVFTTSYATYEYVFPLPHEWDVHSHKCGTFQQKNGVDCGLYAQAFALNFIHTLMVDKVICEENRALVSSIRRHYTYLLAYAMNNDFYFLPLFHKGVYKQFRGEVDQIELTTQMHYDLPEQYVAESVKDICHIDFAWNSLETLVPRELQRTKSNKANSLVNLILLEDMRTLPSMLKINSIDIRHLCRLVRTISSAGDVCGSSLFEHDFSDAMSNENLQNVFEEAFETPLSWDVAKSLTDYGDVPDNVVVFSPMEFDQIRKISPKQSNIAEEDEATRAILRKLYHLHDKCRKFELEEKELRVIIGVKRSSKASSKRQHTCILSWALTFGGGEKGITSKVFYFHPMVNSIKERELCKTWATDIPEIFTNKGWVERANTYSVQESDESSWFIPGEGDKDFSELFSYIFAMQAMGYVSLESVKKIVEQGSYSFTAAMRLKIGCRYIANSALKAKM